MIKEYTFSSIFKEYIFDYLHQKRLLGFSFNLQAYWLYRFDQNCIKSDWKLPNVTKELFETWATRFDNESKASQYSRLSALRGFCNYLNTLGETAYVPHQLPKNSKVIPHLFNDEEIRQFFSALDKNESQNNVACFKRLSKEYKVFFRVIYCCGLRISEACNLKIEDVDLGQGTLIIKQSKGRKDRLVYMSDDLMELCNKYICYLQTFTDNSMIWLFPGKYYSAPLKNTSMDRKFAEIWARTEVYKACNKPPTVHSFRHYFVIKRMNQWIKDDTIDANAMLPYLSSYLGHGSPSETYYYYHQVPDAFEIVGSKDQISRAVIPEVKYE